MERDTGRKQGKTEHVVKTRWVIGTNQQDVDRETRRPMETRGRPEDLPDQVPNAPMMLAILSAFAVIALGGVAIVVLGLWKLSR